MYLLIPVELCFYVVRKKLFSPFRLYMYLKCNSNGTINLDNKRLKMIAYDLNLKSTKTIRNNLKMLIDLNWIGYDKRSKTCYVRGFERLRVKHGFKSRTAAEFNTSDCIKIKGFVIGATIGYLINKQKKARWVNVRKTGRTIQFTCQPSLFFPVANKALSKILNISMSTASLYKRIAVKDKFIVIKRDYKPLGVSMKEKELYLKAFPNMTGKIITRNDKLYVICPDLLATNIRYKKRKKIDAYIQGVQGEDS